MLYSFQAASIILQFSAFTNIDCPFSLLNDDELVWIHDSSLHLLRLLFDKYDMVALYYLL